MSILQYRVTVSDPDAYLHYLATEAEEQVAPFRERGLRDHRAFQSQEDLHEFLIIDQWEGEPQRLYYMDIQYTQACGIRTSVVGGPSVTRLQEVCLVREPIREALVTTGA